MLGKCKFKQDYYDFTEEKYKVYECDEEAVDDELCIFHHPAYWEKHKEEVEKRFMEKVKDAVENEKSLFCIGYHLPKINLAEIEFNAHVYFNNAVFHEEAIFIRTDFSSHTSFNNATFSSDAFFNKAKFYYAYFTGVTFSSNVFFNKATFLSFAIFNNVTFSKKVDFSDAMISSWWVIFSGANFEGVAMFEKLQLLGNAYIVFESCRFEKPHLVSFQGTEVMRFLILSTEIKEISLRNARFEEKILKAHELLKKQVLQILSDYTFDDITETYARLRENFEENRRFSEAGKFFIGEMEVRRTRKYYEFLGEEQSKKGFREWFSFNLRRLFLKVYVSFLSPYALYKVFSEYGESMMRPFAWSLLTIFSIPILFTFLEGHASLQSFIDYYYGNLGKSFGLFIQILSVDYPPVSMLTIIEIIERILGVLFTGLELIALKRKLERHR